MACSKKCLFLTAVLVVAIAYRYRVDVPEGFQKPWTMKVRLGLHDFALDLGKVASVFTGQNPLKFRSGLISLIHGTKTLPHVQLQDVVFDGIPVRVFSPDVADPSEKQPVVVYFHGGGWTAGSVDMYHNAVLHLASESGIKFISVEYRLAPEFPFPIPYEDCLKATQYVLTHAEELHIDAKRVAVMGDSAGGNMAAAISIALRDKPVGQKPKLQVLIYPALQAVDLSTPSYQQNGDSKLILTAREMYNYYQYYAYGDKLHTRSLSQQRHIEPKIKQKYVDKYMPYAALPGNFYPQHYHHHLPVDFVDDDAVTAMSGVMFDERYSPLLADDLSGVAQAMVYTAHYDVLRDDGYWYVLRLRDAGVDVEHFHQMPAYHGMLNMYNDVPEGQILVDGLVKFIKKNL